MCTPGFLSLKYPRQIETHAKFMPFSYQTWRRPRLLRDAYVDVAVMFCGTCNKRRRAAKFAIGQLGLRFPPKICALIEGMTHPTNGLPAPARAALDELVNFCVTLEKSVQDRFKPYRAMFRAFALVDPTYRPADDTLEYLADRMKLGQMCDSYFKLDGGSALSQMDDFRATYKPLQHCEEGEIPACRRRRSKCARTT